MRWLKIIAAAIVVLHWAPYEALWAQDCHPEDITLSYQDGVDSFQTSYGPCTRVLGELKIEGEDIVSLSGLSDLTEIRKLKIWRNPLLSKLTDLAGLQTLSSLDLAANPLLTNLEGLSSIEFISTVRISNNIGLKSLAGLDALERVGHLVIRGNPLLKTMQGLSGLRRVEANEFSISANNSLENLDGLESLKLVAGELVIEDNDSLINIDALASLSEVTIEPSFSIRIQRNRQLANLDGLASLTKIDGGLIIHLNDSLSDVGGLSNLTEVGTWLHIAANHELTHIDGLKGLTTVGSLGLINNTNLSNIHGLEALHTVNWWLEITHNPRLVDLAGLSALRKVGLAPSPMSGVLIEHNALLKGIDGLSGLQGIAGSLVVQNNASLSDCQGVLTLVDPIDDYDPGPGNSPIPDISNETRLQSNLPGCNSVAGVLAKVDIVEINAGLNDAWFNPEFSGQGFFIIVFPDIRQVFLSWFTYDTERPPPDAIAQLGEPGHRWITAQGSYFGNGAELTAYLSKGGVFDASVPGPELQEYGEILLEFSNCNEGTVMYRFPAIGREGVVLIERIVLDNVSLCYVLNEKTVAGKPSLSDW